MTVPPFMSTTISREEAESLCGRGLDGLSFIRQTSHLGNMLAIRLRGGRRADPNVAPAIRDAAELERRLEVLVVLHGFPAATPSAEPRPVPPGGDLKAMLSDASSDARYVKFLMRGGMGMGRGSNLADALRIVRGLRGKLDAIWTIYEGLPKPEVTRLASEEQETFWRKLEAEFERGRTV